MKNLFFAATAILLIISCQQTPSTPFAKISGKITNKLSDKVVIKSYSNEIIKSIAIEEDGTFGDTLHITKGNYIFSDGVEYAKLYLFENSDINITLDTDKFDETIHFEGNGSVENNYTVKKLLLQEEIFKNPENLFDQSEEDFNKALKSLRTKFDDFLKNTKNLDPEFIQIDIDDTEGIFGYLQAKYKDFSELKSMIGQASPEFTEYENIDGTNTSLSDLKGKYIYVDVWATWCRPCLAEIPALKELEKEFGEQMHFVSISIDKEDKYEAWKKMVDDKELKGVQLYADNDWNSQFVKDYKIDGIPRFILIDPDGNVLKPDAERPSNPKTKEMLTSLLK